MEKRKIVRHYKHDVDYESAKPEFKPLTELRTDNLHHALEYVKKEKEILDKRMTKI